MSDDNQNNNQNRGPDYVALSVRNTEDGKSYFNRIGAAFAHGDGKGHNIELDATPVNGRIVLREPPERDDAGSYDEPPKGNGKGNQKQYKKRNAPEYSR